MKKRIPTLNDFINEAKGVYGYDMDYDPTQLAKDLKIKKFEVNFPVDKLKANDMIILFADRTSPIVTFSRVVDVSANWLTIWWTGGEFRLAIDKIITIIKVDSKEDISTEDIVKFIK